MTLLSLLVSVIWKEKLVWDLCIRASCFYPLGLGVWDLVYSAAFSDGVWLFVSLDSSIISLFSLITTICKHSHKYIKGSLESNSQRRWGLVSYTSPGRKRNNQTWSHSPFENMINVFRSLLYEASPTNTKDTGLSRRASTTTAFRPSSTSSSSSLYRHRRQLPAEPHRPRLHDPRKSFPQDSRTYLLTTSCSISFTRGTLVSCKPQNAATFSI